MCVYLESSRSARTQARMQIYLDISMHASVHECIYLSGCVPASVCMVGVLVGRGDNCVPFAVMSGCLFVVMHTLPEGSEAPVTYTVYLAHTQVWWSTWCHRGQTELISCHYLWTSSLFSFPSFCSEYNNTILQCLQRGSLLLNVFLLKGYFLGGRSHPVFNGAAEFTDCH